MSLTVDKCLQAWTNSLSQMNAKADIVFFGDSLTYYGDFANVFPEKVVCNLGLRGDTIHGMIDRIKQIQIVDPYKVFLMAGMNDVAFFSHGDFKKQYELLLKNLFRVLPNIEIVVQSLLPINETYFSISCSNYQIRSCNDVFRVSLRRTAESRPYIPCCLVPSGTCGLLTLRVYP